MPLKIIGVGFGRTGTESTKMALNQLGFQCYHMSEVVKAGRTAMQQWIKAADNPYAVDWDRIFHGYDATVDWPGAFFWKTLIDYYPNAKVILNLRDAEKWYESMNRTLYKNGSSLVLQIATMLIPRLWFMGDMVNKIIWSGTFDDQFLDKNRTIEKFNAHNDEVKHIVPKDRLLLFDVKQGWEPLCAFLNLPVPETAFPNANDANSINKKFADLRRVTYIIFTLLMVVIAIVLFKYMF